MYGNHTVNSLILQLDQLLVLYRHLRSHRLHLKPSATRDKSPCTPLHRLGINFLHTVHFPFLPSINEFRSPAKNQHGFRPIHPTTSALRQLTTDIETGVNQRKPPHRTVCVAIDLTAAFDTVSHDILISKIAGSSLPPAITRWPSCNPKERDKLQLASEVSSRVRESSAPASLKDPSCHIDCSTIT